MDEHQLEKLKFKDQMGNLSNLTFKQVFKQNPDFVDFTQKSMSDGKGIFKLWIKYVKIKSIDGFSKNICESNE
jgi:hypothetical protein